MRARRCNQQCAFGGLLALHFTQVRIRFAGMHQAIGNIRLNRRVPIEMGHGFQQMVHRNHLQPRRQARLLGIRPRHHQRTPGLARRQRRRQHTAHCPHRARQCQLTQTFHIIERQRRHLNTGGKNPQRNRQIESPSVLGQIRRRQIQRDPPRRKLQPRIDDRTAHPILALLHRRLGQADHG
ncbi:hypothetical protein D3C86_1029190 [compost metagenome]